MCSQLPRRPLRSRRASRLRNSSGDDLGSGARGPEQLDRTRICSPSTRIEQVADVFENHRPIKGRHGWGGLATPESGSEPDGMQNDPAFRLAIQVDPRIVGCTICEMKRHVAEVTFVFGEDPTPEPRVFFGDLEKDPVALLELALTSKLGDATHATWLLGHTEAAPAVLVNLALEAGSEGVRIRALQSLIEGALDHVSREAWVTALREVIIRAPLFCLGFAFAEERYGPQVQFLLTEIAMAPSLVGSLSFGHSMAAVRLMSDEDILRAIAGEPENGFLAEAAAERLADLERARDRRLASKMANAQQS